MAITVTTLYAFDMPKYVYIQMFAKEGSTPQPIRIRADKFEKSGSYMILKLGNEQIGEFNAGTIAGWWILDEET